MKRKKQTLRTATNSNSNFDFNNNTAEASLNSSGLSSNKEQDAGFTQSFSSLNQTQNTPKEASFGMGGGANPFNDNTDSQAGTADTNNITLPDWFDQQDFLSGARSAYTLLQEAWDSGNLDEIKALTTDSVYAEISRQHAEDDSQDNTRILQLNAELVDFNEATEQVEAAVLFDALLGESDPQGNNERATQVRELWHFVRKSNSEQPTWYLDGIQQLD